MSKYYGESERLLGKVFSLANELPNGAIVFLDEVCELFIQSTLSYPFSNPSLCGYIDLIFSLPLSPCWLDFVTG